MFYSHQIIAEHSKQSKIIPEEIIDINWDLCLATDATTPLIRKCFDEIGINKITSPHKIVIINDHFVPAKDIATANYALTTANTARKYKTHFYKEGMGISHLLLLEEKIVKSGNLVFGADSHTLTIGAIGALGIGVGSTDLAAAIILDKTWIKVPNVLSIILDGEIPEYLNVKDIALTITGKLGLDGASNKIIEFSGKTINKMSIWQKAVLCNMSAECGATSAVIVPSENRMGTHTDICINEKDTIVLNINQMQPMVAVPYSPSNSINVKALQKTNIDCAFLGSCTGGSAQEIQDAEKIMRGKKISPHVRMIIIPGTLKIYKELIKDGTIQSLLESGAIIGPSTCGPCLGGHLGVLGNNEICISSANRNFPGRMGAIDSKVFLSSSKTVAASAICGYICDPREVLHD